MARWLNVTSCLNSRARTLIMRHVMSCHHYRKSRRRWCPIRRRIRRCSTRTRVDVALDDLVTGVGEVVHVIDGRVKHLVGRRRCRRQQRCRCGRLLLRYHLRQERGIHSLEQVWGDVLIGRGGIGRGTFRLLSSARDFLLAKLTGAGPVAAAASVMGLTA